MKLACSSCRKILQVGDSFVGQRVHCPGCGGSIVVPSVEEVGTLEPWDESAADAATQFAGSEFTPSPRPPQDSKNCRMCGAVIKALALKCRHCGALQGESTGPDGRPVFGVWRAGKLLVMEPGGQLPYVCVKTNRPAEEWLACRLATRPNMLLLFFLFLLGPCGLFVYLIYFVISLLARRRIDIRVGLCRERLDRRRRGAIASLFTFVAGAAIVIAGIFAPRPPDWPDWLILAGFSVLTLGAIIRVYAVHVVYAVRITDEFAWIAGVHPDVLDRLAEFPGDS
jgi:hypothetical protein